MPEPCFIHEVGYGCGIVASVSLWLEVSDQKSWALSGRQCLRARHTYRGNLIVYIMKAGGKLDCSLQPHGPLRFNRESYTRKYSGCKNLLSFHRLLARPSMEDMTALSYLTISLKFHMVNNLIQIRLKVKICR